VGAELVMAESKERAWRSIKGKDILKND